MSISSPQAIRQTLNERVSTIGTFIAPIIGLVILWEVAVQMQLLSQQALPPTYAVWEEFLILIEENQLLDPTLLTFSRALGALFLSIVIGVSLGLIMAQFRAIEWFFDPIVSVGFAVPKVTLVPIYILWFGFGSTSTVLLASTSAVFPIIIATHNGAKAVSKELVWSVRTMGVSRLKTTWTVILPAALPRIFNGIQIAVFLSFVVVVVAEMVTSGGGLGNMIVESMRFFQTARAFVALFVVIGLGLISNGIFQIIRNYLLRWN